MSNRRIKTVLAAIAVGFTSLYISFFILIPRWELTRLGEIVIPWMIKVLSWEDLDIGIRATLQLRPNDADDFIKRNGLVPATGPADLANGHFVIKKCIHGGKNSSDVDFNATTGVARIWIGTPDHSGDKPCEP